MSDAEAYLVVMDVPGIKEYVFGTDRLVEVRGASALLDRLNRVEMPRLLKDQLGKERVKCVFSNGGAAQFVLQAEKNKVVSALEDLRGSFYQKSKGLLRLVYGITEYTGTDYPHALESAFLNLKEAKEGNPFHSATSLHTGYVRECESCAGMASEIVPEYGGEQRILCAACREKVRSGRTRGLWEGFADFLHNKGKKVEDTDSARPENFEEIADRCKARKGYIALVYADGNGMGKLIKRIENAEQFEFFSATVDQSIRQACHEALYENCPFTDKIPADILLLGGDDLLVCLAADTALPFAVSAAERFAAKTQEKFSKNPFFAELLGGKGLTISIGIAYGKSHTPFTILLDQAEELLKSAKKGGSLDPRAEKYFAPTYVDYHLASYFNQVEVDACRKNHLQIRGAVPLFLYQKPYSLEDIKALLDHARTLVRQRVPRSRLKRLGYAPSLGKVNATVECLKLWGRARDPEKRAILNALERFGCSGISLPWKERVLEEKQQFTTALVDLIEVTEFITRAEGGSDAYDQT